MLLTRDECFPLEVSLLCACVLPCCEADCSVGVSGGRSLVITVAIGNVEARVRIPTVLHPN